MQTKTLRLKIKPEAYAWLDEAAIEINQVWNWANETSHKAANPYAGPRRLLSGYDLGKLSSGSSKLFKRISADTIAEVCIQYCTKRIAAKRFRLRWRRSFGSRRSLGWIPFKALGLQRRQKGFTYKGKALRVFEFAKTAGAKWAGGCFAQDACGDWWLCLPVEAAVTTSPAPQESVGVDLGLKAIATTSDGDTLEAGRWTHGAADKLAMAQRRGHKRQAKRIHRKAANQRKDALHKFSRKLVNQYQKIVIGDVSSTQLAKTTMAKSVMDSGWGMLRTQLLYKGEHAGRSVSIVDESYTSRACSSCGSLSGPSGVNGLCVRHWDCVDCGAAHDRDVNAARNILSRAEITASVCGNELRRKRRGMVIGGTGNGNLITKEPK